MLAQFVKTLPQLLVALAVATVVSVLAINGNATSLEAYSVIMALLAAAGVSAGNTLGSAQPNSNVISHLVLVIAVLVLVAVLGAKDVFTNTQVDGVFALIVGAGIFAVGSTATTTTPVPTAPTVQPVTTVTPVVTGATGASVDPVVTVTPVVPPAPIVAPTPPPAA